MYPTGEVYVTAPFGVRGSWAAGYHTGTDFRAAVGTPIYATKGGRVVYAGYGGSKGVAYGNLVVIQSSYWTSKREHMYCHLSSFSVRSGQTVRTGQIIGRSGVTGNVTGPHLHYEERAYPYGYWDHKSPVFLAHKPIANRIRTVSLRKVKPGKRNRHVRRVQKRLNKRLAGGNLPVTGYFGEMTRKKYSDWQRKLGYEGKAANGIPGRNSLERLGFRVKP